MEAGRTTLEITLLAFGVAFAMAALLVAGVAALKWVIKSWMRRREVAQRN
jgi:hypothetical protein